MATGIYLGIGSNLGERRANLQNAVRLSGLKVIRHSSIYETEPVGYLDQHWFLNAVLEVETDLLPSDLLNLCQKVEALLLRVRKTPKGPRTIDLDILFYGDLILQNQVLTLPHPAIQDRRFVLEPLNEIAPDLIHPVLKKTVALLLRECSDTSQVRRLQS